MTDPHTGTPLHQPHPITYPTYPPGNYPYGSGPQGQMNQLTYLAPYSTSMPYPPPPSPGRCDVPYTYLRVPPPMRYFMRQTRAFLTRICSAVGHTHTHTHTHARTHARTYTHTHARTHARTHTHTCAHMSALEHMCSRTHTYTHARTHTNADI